jgi:peptide/nickel transport system permease protein
MQPGSGPVGTASPVEIQPQEDESKPAVARVVKMSKSPTRVALTRLRHDKVAMTGLVIFLIFVLIAIFAPVLAGIEGQSYTAFDQNLIDINGYPTIGINAQHWFGIEPQIGRDLFARWVYGARPSLIISTTVTLITTVVGVTMGLISGFSSGWADRIISWIVDFTLSLPFLLFAIALPAVTLTLFAGGVDNADPTQVSNVRFFSLIFVLSFFGWAGLSRLIRGQVLSLRERDFVAAARVLGVPTRRILFKELLPNLVAPIVVNASITMPGVIAAEAGLTFLGVGLIEPTPSWGITINSAQNFYQADPTYFWIPVFGVTLLVLALSLFGDGIRDAFDPKTRR